MHTIKIRILLVAAILTLVSAPAAYAATSTTGTIDSTQKYAWGEALGWVNMAPTGGNITITDTSVQGSAWSSAFGWINFGPFQNATGVTNTPAGKLGGFAWSENLGWISMSGVTIDANGVLTGVAGVQGTRAGRINFSCDRCKVVSTWRPPVADATGAPSNSSAQSSNATSTPTNDAGKNAGKGFWAQIRHGIAQLGKNIWRIFKAIGKAIWRAITAFGKFIWHWIIKLWHYKILFFLFFIVLLAGIIWLIVAWRRRHDDEEEDNKTRRRPE